MGPFHCTECDQTPFHFAISTCHHYPLISVSCWSITVTNRTTNPGAHFSITNSSKRYIVCMLISTNVKHCPNGTLSSDARQLFAVLFGPKALNYGKKVSWMYNGNETTLWLRQCLCDTLPARVSVSVSICFSSLPYVWWWGLPQASSKHRLPFQSISAGAGKAAAVL